jgi:hypothetical protein
MRLWPILSLLTVACSHSGSAVAPGGNHPVRGCPSGAGAVGVWENITPPDVSLDPKFNGTPGTHYANFGTNAFVIDPTDSTKVYLGTSGQGIYKSSDCGATWTHIDTGANGAMIDQGRNWTMVIDPVEPNVIYTNAGYGPGGVWKSINGGVDWVQSFPPDLLGVFIFDGFVETITMDPTDRHHLIASPHFTCEGSYAVANHIDKNCMMETTDGGATWRVLQGTPDSLHSSSQVMLDRRTWLWAQEAGALYRTDDGGASWTQLMTGTGGVAPSLYRAADGTAYMPTFWGVVKSKDAVNWTVIPNTPRSEYIAGDGTNLYISRGDFMPDAPYHPCSIAKESDPATWTDFGGQLMAAGGKLQYDPEHHILYSSNSNAGFWRVVTQ